MKTTLGKSNINHIKHTWASLLLLLIAPFTVAQTGIGFWGGGFSGAQVCQSSDSETVPYEFTSGTLTANSEVRWMKMVNGTFVDDGLVMTISPSGTVNDITLRVIFDGSSSGNNISVSVFSASPGSTSGSASFFKPEGQYAMRIINSSGTTTYLEASILTFFRGVHPRMAINGTLRKQNYVADVQVLRECVSGILVQNTASCQSSNMSLEIQEVEPFVPASWPFQALVSGGHTWGPNTLNATQAAAVNGSGLDISGFLGSSPGGKTFRVSLTMNPYGTPKTTHMRLHVKDGSVDLRMRDNLTDDNGAEPFDPHATDVFGSPDLWNKLSNTSNPNDGRHEDPDHITIPGNTNKAMVRIENLGCGTSPDNMALRLFWTRARSPEPWSRHWTANSWNMVNSAQPPFDPVFSGSEITISGATMNNPYNRNTDPFAIPNINANDVWTMPFAAGVEWFPPDPADFDATNGQMHNQLQRPIICLLARINETDSLIDSIVFEPDTATLPSIRPYVLNNNNIVTLNTTLVDDATFIQFPGNGTWNWGYSTIGVTHETWYQEEVTIDICLEQLPGGHTEDYLDYGWIELASTVDLWDAWNNGGQMSTNVDDMAQTQWELTDNSGCLENMTLTPGTNETFGVRFHGDMTNLPTNEQHYTFRLYTEYADGSPGMDCLLYVTMPSVPPNPKKDATPLVELSVEGVQVYPNPADELLNLFYPSSEQGEQAFDLEITNMAGQVVQNASNLSTGTTHTVTITDLEAGVYLVSLSKGREVSTHRIVIE